MVRNAHASFAFVGKAAQYFAQGGVSYLSKTNVVLSALEAGVSLVKMACSFAEYRYERKNTEMLRQQIDALKQEIDTVVEEERTRANLEVEETRKRILMQLQQEQTQLEANLMWMQAQVDDLSKSRIESYGSMMKRLEIENRARKPLRTMLDTTVELLEKAQQLGQPSDYVAHLEEEYRSCLRAYERMVQESIKGTE